MDVILIKNKLLKSASYLVGNYLVDCGDSKTILHIAEEEKIEIKGIFLTHCHLDHVYGLPKVMERFPKAKIYSSKMTHVGLMDEKMNLSYTMPDVSFPFKYNENVVILNEGEHLIDGEKVEMIICNGHSNDCQSYILDDNIFTGDACIPFSRVFAKWPTSDKTLARENEKMLLQIAKQRNLTIRPGHWK